MLVFDNASRSTVAERACAVTRKKERKKVPHNRCCRAFDRYRPLQLQCCIGLQLQHRHVRRIDACSLHRPPTSLSGFWLIVHRPFTFVSADHRSSELACVASANEHTEERWKRSTDRTVNTSVFCTLPEVFCLCICVFQFTSGAPKFRLLQLYLSSMQHCRGRCFESPLSLQPFAL